MILLEVAVLSAEAVKRVVSLRGHADESGEDVGLGGAGEAASLVDISNVELDRGVVLGGDKTAGSRAIDRKK